MVRAVEVWNEKVNLFSDGEPANFMTRLEEEIGKIGVRKGSDSAQFVRMATEKLLGVAEKIKQTSLLPNPDPLYAGLLSWIQDGTHGAAHSYDVYTRTKEIRDLEKSNQNVETEISDDELLIRAVLHDLGEFLPVFNQEVETRNDPLGKEWKTKKHNRVMAIILRKLGKHLVVEDAQQLAKDIWHHDDYWSKPTQKRMQELESRLTPAGKLLADGDRLVGDEPSDEVRRNRENSLGKWFFLRPDLTARERGEWQVRTGGLFDGMSAVLTEFTGQDHWFYTQTARELNKKKKEKFRSVLIDFYTNQYTQGWGVLGDAVEQRQPIEFGLRGKTEEEMEKVCPDGSDIKAQIATLLQMPVTGKKKDDREYFGYSIRVRISPDTYVWLDPSILKFDSAKELTTALISAVDEYEQLSSTQETS